MKKIKIFLFVLLLPVSPLVMADVGLFDQLTVTQPPYTPWNLYPDPNGSLVVNGAVDRPAVITINASSSEDVGPASPPATLRLNANGLRRWGVRKSTDVENGNNSGSSFQIERFDDAGNHMMPHPIIITRADGTVTLSGALVSTRACAAGYTRVGPNFCLSDIGGAQVFDSSVSCTETTALTGVSTAKAVMATVSLAATANNATGLRQVTLQAFGQTDNTCATVKDSSTIAAYEFNATAAGTNLVKTTDSRMIRSDTSGRFYAKSINNSSGTGFVARYTVIGYFD